MASYSFRYNVSAAKARLHDDIRERVAAALRDAALTTQAAWQETILRTPGIWDVVRDRYAGSIKMELAPDRLSAKIFSDDPKAGEIEDGEPARDMKQALHTSLKSRVVQSGRHKGQRYLIIPFRHNIPGHGALASPMPSEVYAAVSNRESFASSDVKKRSFRANALGVHDIRTRQLLRVPAREYQWGSRLDTGGMGLDNAQARRYQGMVAFRANEPKQTQSSVYMTFRAMGEWSSGWIQPAKPPKPIVRTAAAVAERSLKENLDAALS